MRLRSRSATLSVALVWCLLTGISSADVVLRYGFFQDGFPEGATLSGTMTGVDLNGDGFLAYMNGVNEFTTFTIAFSGDSFVEPVTFDVSELGGAAYAYNNGPILGDENVEGFVFERVIGDNRTSPDERRTRISISPGSVTYFSEIGNPASVTQHYLASNSDFTVTAIPEPAPFSFWLFLGCVCYFYRRRRATNR